MPMSPRLLRPRASGATHPEALDWATRVTANGGTVSSTTLAAVDKFCRDIDAASGLRAAILRLNLFCGNSDASLNAVRTPLYLSGSFGGATIGNTIDTNFNFAQGDYQETGSGGGLKGNGTNKYLATGFQPANFPDRTSVHLSSSGTSLETSGDRAFLGSWDALAVQPVSQGTLYSIDIYAAYINARAARFSNFTAGPPVQFPTVTTPGASESHFIGTRTASNLATIYRGGAFAASNSTSVTPVSTAFGFFVFAFNAAGSPSYFSAGRLRMYSIGNGLTAAQALAFSNAVIAFNTALGRA